METKKTKKAVAALVGLVALALLASACQRIQMNVGETKTVSCDPGETATYSEGDDGHDVYGVCSGSGDSTLFQCPQGKSVVTSPDTSTLEVFCAPPGEEDGVALDGDAEPETAAPLAMTLTEAEPMSAQTMAATGYCSGGQGWRLKTAYTDLQGRKPDIPGVDSFNVRVGVDIIWCVVSGKVQCGTSFAQYVLEGRFHEINERSDGNGYVLNKTACGISSRTFYIDWDLQLGVWCPWCVGIDWDLIISFDRYGHYWGDWSHNGDGY